MDWRRGISSIRSEKHPTAESLSGPFDDIAAAAALLDATGRIVRTNKAWRLFGHLNGGTTGSGVGANYLDVCRIAADDGDTDAADALAGIEGLLSGEHKHFELEYPCASPTEDRWFLLQASATPVVDGAGALVMHVNTTGRMLLAEQIAAAADRDPGTGLAGERAGKRFLSDAVEQAARHGTKVGVIAVAIDSLDVVTSTMGRPAAHSLIVQVTERVLGGLRPGDLAFRRGHHQLILVCRDTDEAHAQALLDQLSRILEPPFQLGFTEMEASISLGLTMGTAGSNAGSLLDAANRSVRQSYDTYPPIKHRAAPVEAPDPSRPDTPDVPREPRTLRRILVLHDDDAVADHLRRALFLAYPEGVTILRSRTLSGGIGTLASDAADCILLGLALHGAALASAIKRLNDAAPVVGIVVLLDTPPSADVDGGHAYADDAIRSGAQDFLRPDDIDTPALRHAILSSLDRVHARVVQQRLHDLLTSATQVVGVIDRENHLTYVSPSVETMIGVPTAQVVGRPLLSFIHVDDVERVERSLSDTRADGAGEHSVEYRSRSADGDWHWREMSIANPGSDQPNGELVLNIRDITQRRDTEETLRFQANLLESVGQPIVAASPSGEVVYWNHAATELFGPTATEALGRPLIDVVPIAKGWAHPAADVMSALRAGEAWSGEFWFEHPDGSTFPAHVTDTPLLDDKGELLAVIGVTHDLSDRFSYEEARSRLAAIVEASADAIVAVDLAGVITSWNDAAAALYGYAASNVVGKRIDELAGTAAADLGLVVELDPTQVDSGVARSRTIASTGASTGRHIQHHRAPIRGSSLERVGTALIAREITEQVELTRRLEHDRLRLEDAQRDAHVGSYEVERESGAVTWSDELYRILGLPGDTEPTEAAYEARIHPDDRDSVLAALSKAAADPSRADVTHRIVRPDGEVRWVIAHSASEVIDGSQVTTGSIIDVTELKLVQLRLSHQATHDYLTGLPNRAWLVELLADAVAAAEANDSCMHVAMLVIDRLELINDSLGHATGDQILAIAAQRIAEAIGATDIVARFGGDEFVVVRTDGVNGAEHLGKALTSALSHPVIVDGRRFYLTVSTGITTSEPGATSESLLRDADAAMYEAKTRGKAQHVQFDHALRSRNDRRMVVEAHLHHAIEEGELTLAFQPVLDLETLELAGFESLARWHHPELGDVSPEEFIPIAEDCGLIFTIGEWVMRESLRQLALWRLTRTNADHVWMAVNLSARQLSVPRLGARIQEMLDEVGLPASSLHLEITEGVLMDDVEHALEVTRSLHDLGYSISIDDFGTGYSSLSYLKRLPAAILKIDRSFVTGLGRDPSDTSIVTAILGLAHGLGMRVVAEGVENPTQLRTLQDLGCSMGQGFLWSRPVAADVAEGWLPLGRRAWDDLPAPTG